MSKDNEIPGLENARAWYGSIVEMVEALEKARDVSDDYSSAYESAERRIHESVLSVEVRGGWYLPASQHTETGPSPEEYRILLTTGGPGLQLVGTLSEHGEPETAELQSQDWGTPWTRVGYVTLDSQQSPDEFEATLLTFARCFYFGE